MPYRGRELEREPREERPMHGLGMTLAIPKAGTTVHNCQRCYRTSLFTFRYEPVGMCRVFLFELMVVTVVGLGPLLLEQSRWRCHLPG